MFEAFKVIYFFRFVSVLGFPMLSLIDGVDLHVTAGS